ncbi:amidohydrolase/deacetylase family metallohydrolase [Lactobacillus halodurans]|uniref:Amidohydrolase/deacetylase family metallohydrolase n=1 Tax=Companilactobacillus halodurans TaxID=2584183 RepID=A0A5P0ZMP2_9LACO|nr:amidohydrolase/deacetylase family metallohydrolase [Companilactobacillus halodurans]MQS75493.1 amidohydrolase/deacetylase family metallohydrolase [Companilactobacillus halodurans]
MGSLYIRNGKNIDGQPLEVLLEDGKIKEIASQLRNVDADLEINLHNKSYISPGWIDDHVHCYEKLSLYYDDPDKVGYQTGVTTLIDAGSTGSDNVGDFYRLARKKKTNVYAMLNIAKTGILAQNELGDLNKIQLEPFAGAVFKYPDFIIGMKARISKSVVVDNGIKPMILAKQIQAKLPKLPLMVHVGSNPPELEGILDLLEKGDILTHCFNGKKNGILNADGKIKEFVFKAVEKGIIFDIGHGTDSFNFHTAEVAKENHLYPQSLSTDIYHKNREEGPVYNMATCIEKMLYLGFSLTEIIPMITSVPATNFGLKTKGRLIEGLDADVTIFNVEDGKKKLTDSDGYTKETDTIIRPLYSIIGGKIYSLGEKHGSL